MPLQNEPDPGRWELSMIARCDECGVEFDAPDEQPGGMIKCPRCEQIDRQMIDAKRDE